MMMRRLEQDIVVDDKLLKGSRHRLSGCGRSTQLPREIHAEEQSLFHFNALSIIIYCTNVCLKRNRGECRNESAQTRV